MVDIFNLTRSELANFVPKKFQADQIFDWLYKKRTFNFDDFFNVSNDLKKHLRDTFFIGNINKINLIQDKDVIKILYELNDGELVETVVMKHGYGNSLCISTQVGCNMGCLFCESGKLKKRRNLSVSEMVLQILKTEEITNLRINSVVLMGIGEPFDNYDNVIKFLNIINDSKGLNIGARKITVSTCGIVPKIIGFSKLNTQVNLAISLHASNNELRDKLMPINKVYNLEKLIDSIKKYQKVTSRRITIEYVMINSVNDSLKNAQELVQLIKGLNVYINLIPYNDTGGKLSSTPHENIMKFYNYLKEQNVDVTIRRSMGSNINAACGQLRSKNESILSD